METKQQKKPKDKKPKVSKNVLVMGLVSFFNDISSEMIYPLVPIFLTNVLGAPVTIVGLIEGIAESTGSVFKVVFGWISDRLQKRKSIAMLGYLFSACSKLILGMSYVWHLVLVARFSDRFGKGIRTSARDALIVESSRESKRGLSFGLHRALDTMGAVIGPLLAILFIKIFHDSLHFVFYIAAIPGFIGILIFISLVKERSKKPRASSEPILKYIKFPFSFKFFVLISCIFTIGHGSDAFLILRAQNLGFSLVQIILVYVAFNLTYALLSTPAGMVSDFLGKKKVMLLGFFLYALVYLLFGFIQHRAFLWVIFPFYGVFMALTEGVGKAYIADLVPQKNLATAYGIYQTTTGICVLLASLISGMLWHYINAQAPFIFGGIVGLTAGLMFLFVL